MMSPLITGTTAAGTPILACPSCASTSDSGEFYVDAAAGLAECRTRRKGKGAHSLPHRAKIKEFDPNKSSEPKKP